MANEIRIKDLKLDEQAVETNFDRASFPVDLEEPSETVRVSGSFWRRIFHPLKGKKTIDFTAKNLTAHENTGSAKFVAGFLGGGWNIDAKGNAEMRSLKLWEALIVPELIKNQVSISRNETWFTDGGVIEKVFDHTTQFRWATSGGAWAIGGQPIASNIAEAGSHIITFKERPSFRSGDLLKAIVENENGFSTEKMRVTHVSGDYCIVASIGDALPSKEMIVARIGNDIDTDRQWSIYVDALSGYIRVLADMDSFDVALSNIKFQAGNLSGLRGLGYNEEIPPVGVYAPGLYIGTDQVAGLGAMILALENSISLKASAKDVEASLKVQADQIALKVNADSVVSAINLDKSGVLISSDKLAIIRSNKIELEGYTTINGGLSILPNGDVNISGNSSFSGRFQIPFVDLYDSDAQEMQNRRWLIKNNINIRTTYPNDVIILPTNIAYNGVVVSIHNPNYLGSKVDVQTRVEDQDGKGIGVMETFIDTEPTYLKFSGGILQLCAVPDIYNTGRVKWIALNYK